MKKKLSKEQKALKQYKRKIVKYLLDVSEMYRQNTGYDSGLVAYVLKVCAYDVKADNMKTINFKD